MTAQRITIIGDGQMALVMADALITAGHTVALWCPFAQGAADLRASRRSERLPQIALASSVEITDDPAIIRTADLIINAIPTQYIRTVWLRLASHYQTHTPIICVSKGIENDTLLPPTDIMRHVIADQSAERNDVIEQDDLCALSGPTIAVELARHLPATMLAASTNDALACRVQALFDSIPWLRIYRSDDIVGVELAGAAKNVIALAAGMIDGLGAGDNAKSALLARGLAEIARLGASLGARPETFFGIAGVGDLATTCFSPCGRNRTCGERLGRGEALDAVIGSTLSVVEGVATSKSICMLAQQHHVDMPISFAVHAILFEGLTPARAIEQLMRRELKAELIIDR